MENPKIGEKFLLVGSVVGVYGDETTDIAHRHATIQLDDGQHIETNLRNLLDPQIVVQHALGQASLDVSEVTKATEMVSAAPAGAETLVPDAAKA